jgi:hypothetical protein
VLNPTYQLGPQDILDGVVTLCLEAGPEDPCTLSTSDCMELIILGLPVADAGNDQTVCDNAIFVDVAGSSENTSSVEWTTPDGHGFFDNPNAEITQYILSQDDTLGSVDLCMRANAIDPCTGYDEDCITITIDPGPSVYAGVNATICEGESYELIDALASDYASITWTGGDGVFIPGNDVLNPVYEPGSQDIATGSVILCMTAEPLGACVDSEVDCMSLAIVGLPEVEMGPDYNLDCNDYDYVAGEWHTVEATADLTNVSTVLWTSNGDGYFEDATSNPAIYHLGIDDIWKGDVELCIEAMGIGSCQFSASGCMMVYVPQQLIYYDVDTWWGLSSYLDPILTSVPDVMDPLVLIPGSQHLITMINKQGNYFWPEPIPPTNTIGDWEPVGYKIKTKNTPACLPVYGDTLIDQTYQISGAFTFLPVLTNVPVNIDDLFGSHVNDILLMYNWPTGELWTPVASDFDELMPGRAYLLVNKDPANNFTIEFPDFDPLAPHLYPVTKDIAQVDAPWNDVINTSLPHVLLFADEVSSELQIGDVIGAFNNNNVCFGEIEYFGPGSFFRLVAMGDNPYSKDVDGFADGEMMKFVLYRQNTGEVFKIEFRYDDSYPNYDDKFATNGVSMVVDITMTITSVNSLVNGNNINVYPNPARRIVYITSDREMRKLNMLSNLGQLMIKRDITGTVYQIDISAYPPGMYFLRIETTDGIVTTKRLLIE